MRVLLWIVLGSIAGLLASKRFHHVTRSLALDVTLGVAGAIAGGLAFDVLGFPQSTAFVVVGEGCWTHERTTGRTWNGTTAGRACLRTWRDPRYHSGCGWVWC